MARIVFHQLGKDGPLVPAIGFGCMGMSAYYSTKPDSDERRFEILDRAYELGESFWVTSSAYNDSGDLLGKWFARTGKRNEIFLATKFGYEEQGALALPKLRSDPIFVKESCARSLQRLGTSKVDLYLAHRVDGVTPIEKTVEAMVELKEEGKISYLGLGEVSSTTLRRAHRVHSISAIEVEYSPFSREIESEVHVRAQLRWQAALMVHEQCQRYVMSAGVRGSSGEWDPPPLCLTAKHLNMMVGPLCRPACGSDSWVKHRICYLEDCRVPCPAQVHMDSRQYSW